MIYGFGLLDSGFHVSVPGYMGASSGITQLINIESSRKFKVAFVFV
jgi:hypothetical protein